MSPSTMLKIGLSILTVFVVVGTVTMLVMSLHA